MRKKTLLLSNLRNLLEIPLLPEASPIFDLLKKNIILSKSILHMNVLYEIKLLPTYDETNINYLHKALENIHTIKLVIPR